MKLLLSPCIAVMDRLGYRAKFILISVMALAPLLLLSMWTVWEARLASQVVERERAGIETLMRLREVIGAGLVVKGAALLQPGEVLRRRAEFEAKMARFDELAKSSELAVLRSELAGAWQEAAKAVDTEASVEAYASVVERLLALWRAAATEARLEADSDPAVIAAARWQDELVTVAAPRIGEMRDRGVFALQRQFLSSRTKSALTVARSELDTLLDRLPQLEEQVAALGPRTQAQAASETQLQSGALAFGEVMATQLVNAVELKLPVEEFARSAETPLQAAMQLAGFLGSQAAAALDDRLVASRQKVLISLALSGFALLSVAYLFSGAYASIRRSLDVLGNSADAVAKGNLAVRGEALTRDEVGKVVGQFNHMVETFAKLLAEVGSASSSLVQSSGELTDSAAALSSGACSQMAAVHATASAIEQIGASIRQVAQHAEATAGAAIQTVTISSEGEALVNRLAVQMQQLAERVASSVNTIRSLDQRSQEISGIVRVIEGVAGQTNLLALNAAIEAARAGEQGRGFAVVADEVRKLAENTAASTHQIEGMVSSIQNDTVTAAGMMQASLAEVAAGVALAQEAASMLARIRADAHANCKRVAEVSLATREQSLAAQGIEGNIAQISNQADATAEMSNAAANSAGQLDQLAMRLRHSMEQFRLT